MNWPGLNFALLPVTSRKQTHFSGLVQNNSLQCGADTEHQYVWRSSCLEWYRWYPAWTPTKKRKKKTWFLLFTSQTQNELPLWDPLHSLALWSQTGLIKAALLCFSTLFLWLLFVKWDIWSLISTTFTVLPALQWINKVVILALSPVHAEDRPRDICNQQNPQKFGIQVVSRDRCCESGSNTATLWFKSFRSTAAGCFTCHAQSDVLACHRGCFYGSLLNKHTHTTHRL